MPVLFVLLATPYGADLWVLAKYYSQLPFEQSGWLSVDENWLSRNVTPRQHMLRDLFTNVLPGKHKDQIETILGKSPTHDDMRRHHWAPVPDETGRLFYRKTGESLYFGQFDWDFIYVLGTEQILVYDHTGQAMSPDLEFLIIRLDEKGNFHSWYVDGSTRWPRIVGSKARRNFGRTRGSRAS